jgi:uncharacterized membrane protein YhaH (DUF805 family)
MKVHPADLWTWRGSLGRGAYLFWGVTLFALKYNVDRLVSWHWFGRRWSLLDYGRAGEYLWSPIPTANDSRFFTVLLALALPFMAAGVLLTLKRLRDVRLSPWLVLLFFVPVLKLLFFLILCLVPSRGRPAATSSPPSGLKGFFGLLVPRSTAGSAVAGIVFATASSAISVWIGTTVLREYGWALFVGIPFALGFLATLVFGYHQPRSLWSCLGVSLLATTVAGGALLVVAIEGAICLIMAAPLAAGMALVGGFVAFQIQRSEWWQGPTQVLCVAIAGPLLMWGEHLLPPPAAPLFEVTTSVMVDAPPEAVWVNVVSFSELPPPREFLFRAGIAYPVRARIHGTGAGAERRCEFSTGPFVEPIEVWDEPHLLKFSVTSNPAPMQEWTPYEDLRPAHLDGFLQSRAGQFRLVSLAGGRTRLEGTTWYHHHMYPATYWRWWSDYIIHTIHLRVLRHVKDLSERQ